MTIMYHLSNTKAPPASPALITREETDPGLGTNIVLYFERPTALDIYALSGDGFGVYTRLLQRPVFVHEVDLEENNSLVNEVTLKSIKEMDYLITADKTLPSFEEDVLTRGLTSDEKILELYHSRKVIHKAVKSNVYWKHLGLRHRYDTPIQFINESITFDCTRLEEGLIPFQPKFGDSIQGTFKDSCKKYVIPVTHLLVSATEELISRSVTLLNTSMYNSTNKHMGCTVATNLPP